MSPSKAASRRVSGPVRADDKGPLSGYVPQPRLRIDLYPVLQYKKRPSPTMNFARSPRWISRTSWAWWSPSGRRRARPSSAPAATRPSTPRTAPDAPKYPSRSWRITRAKASPACCCAGWHLSRAAPGWCGFEAEVLPQNRAMLAVFEHSGLVPPTGIRGRHPSRDHAFDERWILTAGRHGIAAGDSPNNRRSSKHPDYRMPRQRPFKTV